MPGHDIIVIGASAGGIEALVPIIHDLPANLPASIFLTVHIPAEAPSLLPNILSRAGSLRATHAEDKTSIEQGHIYVAPPDHHLLLEQGLIRLSHGPKENRHRPAIDPLFRSAALSYGPRVIGIILTGSLNDGTAGLMAIKRRGGLTIIQDPQEALYPSMPQSAQEHVAIDYCLPIAKVGPQLEQLVHEPTEDTAKYPVPPELEKEVKIMTMETNPLNSGEEIEEIGKPSIFGCPECGGVLWELQDGTLMRYRCRTGHAYTPEGVLSEQAELTERALWTALKTLEERAQLLQRMLDQAHEHKREWMVSNLEERLREAREQCRVLRQVLIKDTSNPQDTTATSRH